MRIVDGEVVFERPDAEVGATAEEPQDLDDDAADGGASNHTSDHDSWYGQLTKHNTDRGGDGGSWMTVHKDEDHPPGNSSESEADEDDGPKPSDDAYICIPRPADDKLKPEASLDVGDFFQKRSIQNGLGSYSGGLGSSSVRWSGRRT